VEMYPFHITFSLFLFFNFFSRFGDNMTLGTEDYISEYLILDRIPYIKKNS
jgi:hypothetical protein